MSKFLLFSLLLLSSCALFQKSTSLKQQPIEDILQMVRLTGEGRGRLGLDQNNYIFSYEALIKNGDDWLLAVSVPLHGEEVMLLTNLTSVQPDLSSPQSFEFRLQQEIDQRYWRQRLSGKQYVQELRSMIRFLLAKHLGLKRECRQNNSDIYMCEMDGSNFELRVEKGKLRVKKNISAEHQLELLAENLTESFFARTNFLLLSQKGTSIMSLELFWK